MNIEHRTSNIECRARGHGIVRFGLGVLAAGMVLSVGVGAQQQGTNFPSRDAFSIIQQNNIFNPNRTYYRPESQQFRRRERVDAFALTGTMSYSKGRFAFFDGSKSDYKKVLEPGGTIAGYTVMEITQTNVTLSANGKDFGMAVGSQMRNVGTNKWELSGHIIEETEADEANGETNGEAAAADASTPPAGGSSDMNDVLKQMMLRRQQELSK